MIDDTRAKRNVAVLVAAQAFLGAQMPMIFLVGGLAGQSLAGNICFATLPISMIVLGSMLAATPVSAIMQKYGRRVGFFVGAAGGAVGALVAAYGLYLSSFPIFLLGSFITGIYMSAQGFYRFAAADTASDEYRAKAISYVLLRALQDDIPEDELCLAKPGRALGVDAHWHPDLMPALAPIQTVAPGDTVWWHPDVIHAVGNEHRGQDYASVIYIGASPACTKNRAYALQQSKCFIKGTSAPDFAAEDYEVDFKGRATLDDLTELGKRQMAL